MEGRSPRLHLRSLAFQVHEGIFHYDNPLDSNREELVFFDLWILLPILDS